MAIGLQYVRLKPKIKPKDMSEFLKTQIRDKTLAETVML